MRPARNATLLVACLAGMACQGLPDFDFAIGDISGIWVATSYEYRVNGGGAAPVDVIQRDGATFTMSIDNSTNPASVSAVLDDGSGSQLSSGGTVNPVDGTLTLSGDVYAIEQDGNNMTLSNSMQTFDFGGGAVPATLIIQLARL